MTSFVSCDVVRCSQYCSIQRLHPRPRPVTTQSHRTIHPPTRKKSRSSKSCLEEALGGYTPFYSSHPFFLPCILRCIIHHLLSPPTPGPTDRVPLSQQQCLIHHDHPETRLLDHKSPPYPPATSQLTCLCGAGVCINTSFVC